MSSIRMFIERPREVRVMEYSLNYDDFFIQPASHRVPSPRVASPAEVLADTIDKLVALDVQDSCLDVYKQLPTEPSEMLDKSNEVREMMKSLVSLHLAVGAKLRSLHTALAHSELDKTQLATPLVQLPQSHEENDADSNNNHDEVPDRHAMSAAVSASSSSVPASSSSVSVSSSSSSSLSFSSVLSSVLSSRCNSSSTSTSVPTSKCVSSKKEVTTDNIAITETSAEDHHMSLDWAGDVPDAQLAHMWTEHRQRFPLCSSC